MPIETVRLSKKSKDQLTTLKRRTGITTWNVLCRWAFCVSIAEKTPPRKDLPTGEHPIEMTWRTFAGEHEEIYLELLRDRCLQEGLSTDDATLSRQLRLHLYRGIGYLVGDPNMQSISNLTQKALEARSHAGAT